MVCGVVIAAMTPRKLFQLIAWICFTAIAVLSLVSPSLRPVTVLPHNLEHGAMFALTGLAVGLGYPARPVLQLIAMVAFAGAIELAQFFAPGRHARLIDFVVDASGACAGVLIAVVLASLWSRAAEHRS
jgi:VanZ family protein